MKKIFVTAMIVLSLFSNVSAFEITSIGPDTDFLESRNITDDVNYLRQIAYSYSDRFVVTTEEYADISAIDEYYAALSAPLTLKEIDNGQKDLNMDLACEDQLNRKLNLIGIFGGLSGYTANFEPVAYFNIYRNIQLIGGYTSYTVQYENSDEAYWECIYRMEDMTKEIIPYETRLAILEKIRILHENTKLDQQFKIFLLVDGKINSIWERSDEG